MSVTIREKPKYSGVWWVFIHHNGRRKSKRIGRDKLLAKRVAEQIDARLKLGQFSMGKELLFGEYAEKFMNVTLPAMYKISTEKTYRGILKKHVLPVFKNTPVTELNRLSIKEFLMQKLNDGYSQSTVNHIKCAIGVVLSLAVDNEVISVNPTHKLGNIYGKQKLNMDGITASKIDPLTHEELSLLLSTFQEYLPLHYPIALTLARTGMRSGEVFGLQWGDIDFHGRFIHVQRSYSHGRIETPKNGKSRRVDMSLQLTETLWRFKREREREMGEDMPEWVFINKAGNPLSSDNWRRRIFYKALNKAELRHIRVHDLRHTYASLLLQAGESMVYVRDQLGHYSIRVTVDIYGHLVPGGNKEAVDRLDDLTPTAPNRTLYAPKMKKDLTHVS